MVTHDAGALQLVKIHEYLVKNDQLDPRYTSSHYLSSCQWSGAFIKCQRLESFQISFGFELCDLSLSRKRLASSEPAFRPAKEPNNDTSYWTDTSDQSLHQGLLPVTTRRTVRNQMTQATSPLIETRPTVSTAITATNDVPLEYRQDSPLCVPPGMGPTATIVTCRTPRLTDSGMAEFVLNCSPPPNSEQMEKEYEENIAPSIEVLRELEQEEAEIERQMILDSQTRRDIENQRVTNQNRFIHELNVSSEAQNELEMESELRHERVLSMGRRAVQPADMTRKYHR